jgi:tetratricopeptide (TPR) repeat protein
LERVEITPFVVIAGEILQGRKTGYLTVVKPPLRKTLYWSQGELVLIASSAPEDSLGELLVRRGVMAADRVFTLLGADAVESVVKFHESGLLDLSSRQALLREWVIQQFVPLFSLDEGTAAFHDDEPLPPDRRIFLPSTAALVIDGVRAITNGLVLRRSLGDLKRSIELVRHSRFTLDAMPLSPAEQQIANALQAPMPIDAFLKQFPHESVMAAKVVISLLALGVFGQVEERAPQPQVTFDDMQRDLELLAAIGSNDQRSLRTVAFSRQLQALDHYQVLDVPRAATRAQIINAADLLKRKYDPNTFPPIVRDSVLTIHRRADEALSALRDPTQRASYDRLLQNRPQAGEAPMEQRLTQRSIAEQNYTKAKELTANGDYYGAIVLLRQAVRFAPDHALAWQLLGTCQERNPRWRRDAVESYQTALSIDPNLIEAMLALGELYRHEGLGSRALSCFEDALKIDPENETAKRLLAGVRKK